MTRRSARIVDSSPASNDSSGAGSRRAASARAATIRASSAAGRPSASADMDRSACAAMPPTKRGSPDGKQARYAAGLRRTPARLSCLKTSRPVALACSHGSFTTTVLLRRVHWPFSSTLHRGFTSMNSSPPIGATTMKSPSPSRSPPNHGTEWKQIQPSGRASSPRNARVSGRLVPGTGWGGSIVAIGASLLRNASVAQWFAVANIGSMFQRRVRDHEEDARTSLDLNGRRGKQPLVSQPCCLAAGPRTVGSSSPRRSSSI